MINLLLTFLLIVVVLFPSLAAGQPPNVGARFALHAIPEPTGKTVPPVCPGDPGSADPITNGIDCGSVTTARPGGSYNWVYLLIGGADQGIGGASFGVEYHGIYEPTYLSESGWTLCSDGLNYPSETPPWPASGSGIRLFWNTCQETYLGQFGIHAVAAKFYMYAYSGASFSVTSNLTTGGDPELAVTNCSAVTTNLLDYYDETLWFHLTGRIDFGGGPGYVPCLWDPAEPSTWGRIKTLFTGDSD